MGIEGCGGPSGGVFALLLAAKGRRVGIMAVLTEAGAVDTGEALNTAAGRAARKPYNSSFGSRRALMQELPT